MFVYFLGGWHFSCHKYDRNSLFWCFLTLMASRSLLNCHCIEMCSMKPVIPGIHESVPPSHTHKHTVTHAHKSSHMPLAAARLSQAVSEIQASSRPPNIVNWRWAGRPEISDVTLTDFSLCLLPVQIMNSHSVFPLVLSSRVVSECRPLSLASQAESDHGWNGERPGEGLLRPSQESEVQLVWVSVSVTLHTFPCFSARVCPLTIPARFGLIEPTD